MSPAKGAKKKSVALSVKTPVAVTDAAEGTASPKPTGKKIAQDPDSKNVVSEKAWGKQADWTPACKVEIEYVGTCSLVEFFSLAS